MEVKMSVQRNGFHYGTRADFRLLSATLLVPQEAEGEEACQGVRKETRAEEP